MVLGYKEPRHPSGNVNVSAAKKKKVRSIAVYEEQKLLTQHASDTVFLRSLCANQRLNLKLDLRP